jgi:hypothetical protein
MVMVAENAASSVIFVASFYLFSLSLSLSLSLSVLVPPTDYTPIPIDDTQVTTSSDYEPQEVCPEEHKSSIISFLFV